MFGNLLVKIVRNATFRDKILKSKCNYFQLKRDASPRNICQNFGWYVILRVMLYFGKSATQESSVPLAKFVVLLWNQIPILDNI